MRTQGGKGNVARAIEYYHKALSLRPEDTLSTEMLTIALQVRALHDIAPVPHLVCNPGMLSGSCDPGGHSAATKQLQR